MMNRLPIYMSGKGSQYLFTICIILAVSGICFTLSGFIGYQVVALILLVTVSLIAVSFDILPVLLAAILSASIWDFFFISPRFAFHVHKTEDAILLSMYFIIAMINGILTYKIRQAEKTARVKEERANSVKLYNTILNSLSHELRTPIATIVGATDNLQINKNLTGADKDQLLTEISKAALRLNQQVENLLNISRLESGHIQPKKDWCDIVELVYDVVGKVEENNQHRKIDISINQNLQLCYLDKGMLDQVLYNTLNNAAIHTPLQSSIVVSASCHADMLELIIEDSGVGFKQKEMNDVFFKFSRTTSNETSGSGLGLSIVRGFTEALGGTVSLDKGSLGGARFTVLVPVRMPHTSIKDE